MYFTLYERDTVKIEFDENRKLLKLSWFDHAIDNIFMEVIKEMYRLTVDLGIELWLLDASHAFGVKTWDNNWKCEVVTSALANTKLRKIARVVSQDIAYEAKINAFSDACIFNVKKQFFTTEESACNWLLQENGA